ncbi:MAG: hypothetical protein MK085_08140 [Phycisphaerales bacterium]|nr:hypothetical protein [Phycisphaerales bacterium]
MPFTRGSVSYARFRVAGDAPVRVDASLLPALEASVLRPTIGAPIEVETGWTGGRHILDGDFSHANCVFDSTLHAAMRMDSVRVPAEVRAAYLAQEGDALRKAAADAGGDGERPLGRAARKETKENAERRWLEEVADGRYRSSALVPVLWDLPNRRVLAPAGPDRIWSALRDLMQASVGVRLQPLGAGALALDLLAARGLTSAFDDARPDPLVTPPTPRFTGEDTPVVGDRPSVPWAEAGPEPRDFLGNLFLVWLWWQAECHEGVIDLGEGREVAILVDRMIDMDCAWGVTGRQTLRGDGPTRTPEATKALQAGKWPRKLGLEISDQDRTWSLDLQGDLFRVSALKLPRPEQLPGSEREAIEERFESTLRLDDLLVAMFDCFLRERFSGTWTTRRDELRNWITQKGKSPVPMATV